MLNILWDLKLIDIWFEMSKINLDFAAPNLSEDNYLKWALDTEFILKSKDLVNESQKDDNAKWEKLIQGNINYSPSSYWESQRSVFDNWESSRPLDIIQIEIWSPKKGVITKSYGGISKSRTTSPWMSLLLANKKQWIETSWINPITWSQ